MTNKVQDMAQKYEKSERESNVNKASKIGQDLKELETDITRNCKPALDIIVDYFYQDPADPHTEMKYVAQKKRLAVDTIDKLGFYDKGRYERRNIALKDKVRSIKQENKSLKVDNKSLTEDLESTKKEKEEFKQKM
jgi:hypothetical protein